MEKNGVKSVVSSLEHQSKAKGHLAREEEHHRAAEADWELAKVTVLSFKIVFN